MKRYQTFQLSALGSHMFIAQHKGFRLAHSHNAGTASQSPQHYRYYLDKGFKVGMALPVLGG